MQYTSTCTANAHLAHKNTALLRLKTNLRQSKILCALILCTDSIEVGKELGTCKTGMLPSLWGRQSWITEMLNAFIEIDQNNINDALPAEILQTIFRLVDLTFIKIMARKPR